MVGMRGRGPNADTAPTTRTAHGHSADDRVYGTRRVMISWTRPEREHSADDAGRTQTQRQRSHIRNTKVAERAVLHPASQRQIAERAVLHEGVASQIAERRVLHTSAASQIAKRSVLQTASPGQVAERAVLHVASASQTAERVVLHTTSASLA